VREFLRLGLIDTAILAKKKSRPPLFMEKPLNIWTSGEAMQLRANSGPPMR